LCIERGQFLSSRCTAHNTRMQFLSYLRYTHPCTSYLRHPLSEVRSGQGGWCGHIRSFSNSLKPLSLTPSFADRPKAASGITWCRHMTSPRISPRERPFPLALPPSPFIRDIHGSVPFHHTGTPSYTSHRPTRPPRSSTNLRGFVFSG